MPTIALTCTIAAAVELCERHKPDLAIFDLRLAGGELGTEIAAQLESQDRPGILYATGNAGQSNLAKADGEARLAKPYRSDDVIRALRIVEEIVSTGQTSERVCHVWLVRAQLLTKLGKSGWGGHSSLPGVEGLAPQACDGCRR